MGVFDQSDYAVRCAWARRGLEALRPVVDVFVVVDVLSFTTCVDVATARGATVYPHAWSAPEATSRAASLDALVAAPRGEGPYSLSPASLQALPPGTRLVLPSPNGSTLSLATGRAPTFAACLRNASAVAEAAAAAGRVVGVIAAGEHWDDGSIRPALEDWLGAGAVVAALPGTRSPEAQAAAEAYEQARGDMMARILDCASGRELRARGFEEDVRIAAEVGASRTAARLEDEAYRAAETPSS